MIFFDVTQSSGARHRSGLTRVSRRLIDELGAAATPVRWDRWNRAMTEGDWFITADLFSEAERPGVTDFLRTSPGRKAAIYHDAIPLKFPQVTWPQSVARHPGYLKLLASFDRIRAVSAASRDELLGFWRWQGIERPPPVDVLALGADFDGASRVKGVPSARAAGPVLLSVGILEPRKNQVLLLDVAEALWSRGTKFELHLCGRVNPHFGAPILARVKALKKKHRGLHYHAAASDAELGELYARARAALFPTRAEGCGLPVIEALWRGVPCLCSDLPVLRENADGGGCLPVALDDRDAWTEAVRRILSDDALAEKLAREARTRPLPTWRETAASLRAGLAI